MQDFGLRLGVAGSSGVLQKARVASAQIGWNKTLLAASQYLGSDHDLTLQVLKNLVASHFGQKEFAEGEDVLRKFLVRQGKKVGLEELRELLINSLREIKTLEMPENYVDWQLRTARHELDPGSIELGIRPSNIGTAYSLLKNYMKAETVLEEALSILEDKESKTPFHHCQSILGEVLHMGGRKDEAYPLLRSGYEGLLAWHNNASERHSAMVEASFVRLRAALDRESALLRANH